MKENKTKETSSQGRRRFLKGAAVVTPVMITVASRPVLGAQCTPSAWVSGNLSDHGHERKSCGGRSPGYWKTNHDMRWSPTGYISGTCETSDKFGTCTSYKFDGSKFNSVFISGNAHYDGKSLMQVLWLKGYADPYQLGSHIVAALLNAAWIPSYGMDVAMVKDIYKQLVTSGVYQPSSGDAMTAQDVVTFIQNTFD